MGRKYTIIAITIAIFLSLVSPAYNSTLANTDEIYRIGTGANHTLVLTEDQTQVVAVGSNRFGQLGNGTTDDALVHVLVSGLPNKTFTQVHAGRHHSVLLTEDGEVYTWGYNNHNQLGREIATTKEEIANELRNILSKPFATTIRSAIITYSNSISSLEGIISVLSEKDRKKANENWAETEIQYEAYTLMDEFNTSSESKLVSKRSSLTNKLEQIVLEKEKITPNRVLFDNNNNIFDNVIALATGAEHTLALKQDGTVWAWGKNDFGQIGNHKTENVTLPTQLNFLEDIVSIEAYDSHSLAVTEDGDVWAWGKNFVGLLGNDVTMSAAPMQLTELTNIKSVSASSSQLLALKDDGTVWSIKLEDLNSETPVEIPNRVPHLDNITVISSGGDHHLALKNDGTVWAWGKNNKGQLGDGTAVVKDEAVQVDNIENIKQIYAGPDYSFAIDHNNKIQSWGSNQYGKLGIGLEKGEEITTPHSLNIITIKNMFISPSKLTLQAGETATLNVHVEPANAPVKSVEWYSSNSYCVDVDDNGKVTTGEHCTGITTIKVNVNDMFHDEVQIEVTNKIKAYNIEIELGERSYNIAKNEVWWLGIGETVSLQAAALDSYNADADKVIWTSSDPIGVRVDPYGTHTKMTGLTTNKVIITATSLYHSYNEEEVEDSFIVKTFPWKAWELQTTTDRNKEWNIKLNTYIQNSSVNEDTVYVVDEYGKRVDTYTSVYSKEIRIQPLSNYDYNKTYYLYVSKNVKSSTSENALKEGIKMPFLIKKP